MHNDPYNPCTTYRTSSSIVSRRAGTAIPPHATHRFSITMLYNHCADNHAKLLNKKDINLWYQT